MSPARRERITKAISRHEKTLEHWNHEKNLTKDKSRIKYCEKKIDKMQFCIDRSRANLK